MVEKLLDDQELARANSYGGTSIPLRRSAWRERSCQQEHGERLVGITFGFGGVEGTRPDGTPRRFWLCTECIRIWSQDYEGGAQYEHADVERSMWAADNYQLEWYENQCGGQVAGRPTALRLSPTAATQATG